jgi:hypothetical protein
LQLGAPQIRRQFAIAAMAAGGIGYVIFMGTIDVPTYFARWQADLSNGKQYLGLLAGLHDVASLGRDLRHRPMEGRDRLDVALFQHDGVDHSRTRKLQPGETPLATPGVAQSADQAHTAAGCRCHARFLNEIP